MTFVSDRLVSESRPSPRDVRWRSSAGFWAVLVVAVALALSQHASEFARWRARGGVRGRLESWRGTAGTLRCSGSPRTRYVDERAG